jgi:iron complex outermembrane recepter protein
MRVNDRLATVLCLSIAAVLQSAAAQAQDAGGIEEVVVTAQKRSESAQDVGISMTAFTGDMLSDRGVLTAEDMAALTPGLLVNQSAATGVPVYTIRGVGFNDYSTAASSTVGLYVDEVSIPYTVASRGAVFDVERVEVLKGPQGDLYGRNTTAGQINFISRKPTKEGEGGLRLGFGSYSALDAEGYASGPLSDTVQGRLALKVTRWDKGWQESVTRPGDRLGEKNVLALRGQLNFDLSDAASLLLSGTLVKDTSENQAATAYRGTDIGLPADTNLPTIGTPSYSLGDNTAADWSDGIYYPRRNNKLKAFSGTLNWDLGAVSLTSITAYSKFTRSEGNDWDGSAIRDSSNLNVTDLKVFSQEVRLASNGDGPLSWIVGGYYSDDKMNEAYNYFMEDSFFSAALDIQTLATRYEQKTKSAAAFGHVEWAFNDQWKLITGLRYTNEKREFTGCTYDTGDGSLAGALNNIITPFLITPNGLPVPGPVAPGECGVYNDVVGTPNYGEYAVFSDEIGSDRVMWKVSLNYQPSEDILLFAGISQGVKSGGFNGANANTHSQIVPYRAETLLSYEVGIKSTLLDRTLQLNSSIFYYDYKNKQETDFFVTFVGAIGGITNVPKSTIKGLDFDLQWAPIDGLTASLGGTYLDAKVDEWSAVDPASVYPVVNRIDQAGRRLGNAPRWQYNASLGYEWALGANMKMSAAADYGYKGSTSAPNRFAEIASYGVANARVGFGPADDKWNVQVWVKNLSDKYYYTAAFLGGNGPYVRALGLPRTFGVTVDFKF